MHAACPMAGALILGMAAQANAIRVRCRTFSERYDFRNVSAAIYVKASWPVTPFATNTLLRVIRVLEVLRNFSVAGSACLGSDWLGPRNPKVFCKRSRLLRGLLRR